jgi:PRC-barrel domain
MSNVKLSASTILGAFEEAHSEIIGKAVVLTDGKAGTVETIWLDELHGLLISIRGHDGKWPISTIKLEQSDPFQRPPSQMTAC